MTSKFIIGCTDDFINCVLNVHVTKDSNVILNKLGKVSARSISWVYGISHPTYIFRPGKFFPRLQRTNFFVYLRKPF